MVKSRVGALALALLPSTLAFRNTSPFFLFSTAELLLPNNEASILASSSITSDVLTALKHCPTRSYLIVEQESVSSADYLDGHSTPQLSKYIAGKREEVRTSFAVPEVVGQIDVKAIIAHLQAECAPSHEDNTRGSWFSRVQLPAPAAARAFRTSELQTSDAKLDEHVINEAKSQDYTVIYVTTPQSSAQADAQFEQEQFSYDMGNPFGDGIQMELKRDLSSHAKRANSTQGGLFERYQFFTPGIFMGLVGIIPLFLILLVGIRALTSLEVSYFAFSKEMGPNAPKKQ